MAMTKKEREALREAKLLAALRWTTQLDPDLPTPAYGEKTAGWAVCYDTVQQAWSRHATHGKGSEVGSGMASQRGIPLHSTRLRALRALRHVTELRCAEELLRIDEQIAAEMAKED